MPDPSVPVAITVPAPAEPVLLVTSDPALSAEVERVAAAVGVPVRVVGAPAAGAVWGTAALVLVGDDLSEELSSSGRPRRTGVVVVRSGLDDPTVWQRAVALGVEHVVVLPEGAGWLGDRIADAGQGVGGALVLAVLGGRGGAGATTLATALAFAGARAGLGTLLVDGDPLGGGIDLVFGAEDVAGLRWPDLAGTRGRLAPSALQESLPSLDGLTVLSWDRGDPVDLSAEAADSVLSAAVRGFGLVVVDLPRRPDVAAEATLRRADRTLLVVPAEIRAVAAACRVVSAVGSRAADVRVVVRGPAPSDIDPEVVASSVGVPYAGYCRAEPGLSAALDLGQPPGRTRGPLARLADRLLADACAGARAGAAR